MASDVISDSHQPWQSYHIISESRSWVLSMERHGAHGWVPKVYVAKKGAWSRNIFIHLSSLSKHHLEHVCREKKTSWRSNFLVGFHPVVDGLSHLASHLADLLTRVTNQLRFVGQKVSIYQGSVTLYEPSEWSSRIACSMPRWEAVSSHPWHLQGVCKSWQG